LQRQLQVTPRERRRWLQQELPGTLHPRATRQVNLLEFFGRYTSRRGLIGLMLRHAPTLARQAFNTVFLMQQMPYTRFIIHSAFFI
jgi:hypothetical protein